jgi:hypothetical protein
VRFDPVGEIPIYSGEMQLVADLDELIEFKRRRLERMIDNLDENSNDGILVFMLLLDYWRLLCDAGYVDMEAIKNEMEEERRKEA